MKTLFFYLIIITTLFFNTSICYSQSDEIKDSSLDTIKIKYVNIGVKVGIPNLIGGSVEVLLPVLGNRISPYFDYSGFNIDTDQVGTKLSYSEYGANLYFNKKGNGFFVSLGKAKFDANLTFNELNFSDDGNSTTDSASTNLNFNTTNIKLGIKTGGAFYFRFEIGFGLGDIPDAINFTATSNGITENFSEEIPAIPGLGQGGILIGNIGFGLAF